MYTGTVRVVEGVLGLLREETVECPLTLTYYHFCVKNGHKNFTWTGPPVKIVSVDFVIGLMR